MPKQSDNPVETLSDAAIDWLVLMRSGSAGADTRHAFERWLQASPEHRQAYAEAEALWANTARTLEQTRPAAALPAGVKPARTAVRRAWRPGLAEAATVLIGAGFVWAMLAQRPLGDYATRPGEQKQVVLADGSTVLLNTDSAIALDWSADRRRIVLLQGQAEFKVAKDRERPFVVAANDVSVRALGTVFEVYVQTSGAVDVSVSEHAVAVDLQGTGEDQRRVEQGQQLHYRGDGALARPVAADLHRINAWTRGKLIFRDRPLTEVVAELNRYSKARIVLQGDGTDNLRVSGVFPVDGRLVLEALEKSFSLRALHLGPWLVILHA